MSRPYLGTAEEEKGQKRACRNVLHFRIPYTSFELCSFLCHFSLKLKFWNLTSKRLGSNDLDLSVKLFSSIMVLTLRQITFNLCTLSQVCAIQNGSLFRQALFFLFWSALTPAHPQTKQVSFSVLSDRQTYQESITEAYQNINWQLILRILS